MSCASIPFPASATGRRARKPGAPRGVCFSRREFVVIADEAHRSQYGFGGKIKEKTGEVSYGLESFRPRLNRVDFVSLLTLSLGRMEWLTKPDVWISLITLTFLEIVLGIDNIIFISILSGKLPPELQKKARQIGLGLAMITRILLLCSLAWVVRMEKPFWEFTLSTWHVAISGRDLILILGGFFLVWKSTREIHEKLEGEDGGKTNTMKVSFSGVLVQIMILDIVFSLDSVITAIGMVKEVGVMIAAVILAVIVMLIFVNQISGFVDKHPSVKMLALSFLILIGVLLVAEGFGQHISKGYVYFAMAFSVCVEMLNIRAQKKASKVKLNQPYR